VFFFLPYKIERRFRSFPWVTVTLIVLNVAVYAATAWNLEAVFPVFGFRPNAAAVYTWFTYMFIHGGLMHLVGNMYFLWLFGSMAEDGLGKVRYTILYFAGGLAAAVLHALITAVTTPEFGAVPLVGASGAIAAVIGVVAVRMYRARIRVAYFFIIFFVPRWGTWKMSAAVGVGLYLAQELAYGVISTVFPSGTAHWAHVGGLIAGVVLGLSWGSLRDAATEYLAEEAEGYVAAGLGDVAAAKYSELAEKDPDNPDWLLEKLRSSLIADIPNQGQICQDFAKLAILLQKAGRSQQIVETYRIVAQGSQLEQMLDSHTLQMVASAAESLRDFDTAQRAYATLLVVHPTSTEAERALFRLAHIYLARGEREEALQTWRAFAESYPQSAWLPYADSSLAAS